MRIAAPERRSFARRENGRRLLAMVALFILGATMFAIAVGHLLIRQVEDRRGLERHAALLGVVDDIRRTGREFTTLDPRHVRDMGETEGLKALRFETGTDAETALRGRELQPVLDGNGRIIGWFSWDSDKSLSRLFNGLAPLLASVAIGLVVFAALALWWARRAMREAAESEALTRTLAHEDPLTGLPNHRKAVELIDDMLARRCDAETVTLAHIDLDGLRDVNDAFGQETGDRLLGALAMRLKQALPAHALCSRFNGDEFAVAVTMPNTAAGQAAIDGTAQMLAKPYWLDGQAVQLGATIGFAHAPSDAKSRDALMRRAALALRAAKRKQRGGVCHFRPSMEVEFQDRRFLERDLRRALAEGTLKVYYQPIVSADGARVVGVEALARWDHPQRGPIPPAHFVAVAERCGLMRPLGEFVLRRALADARRWAGVYVAVNLSPVQVRDPGLVKLVAEALAEFKLPASRLVLEITEGVLVDNPAEAKSRLDALRRLGVGLALDDFGTGFSSLTYLQRFKFDKLKIDRGFIEPLGRSREGLAMIEAIVGLGRALGLGLLAEGVETERQRVLLRLAGCQEMQGFLFAQPAPAAVLDGLLTIAEMTTPLRVPRRMLRASAA